MGIAPRLLQTPHPPLYGGFAASMRTALFWAKYGGKPIVLTDNLKFYDQLCRGYSEEAARHGRTVKQRPAGRLGWHLHLRADRCTGPGMGQGHDVVLAELGDALRPGCAGAAGRASPDTICRRLEQVQKVIPDQDEVILLIPQGIHDRSQILTSLELMATKVMPKFA